MDNFENTNLIRCTSCGKEIAKSARMCPSCGAKVKQPIYKSKLFWFVAVVAAIILFFILKKAIANAGNKIVVGARSYSFSEFEDIVANNDSQFRSEFVGEYATITGRITAIKSSFTSTNLNYTFTSVIVIEDMWYLEVSASNPILSTVEVGDKVTATAQISTNLYDDVYCYGNATFE